MSRIEHPPVREAMQHLEEMYAERDLRLLAVRREMAVTDYWLGLEDARQKGHEAGVTSGREAGLREVLQRMLTRKFGEVSAESQRRLAGADALRLEQWAEQVLDAATEGEVFR